MPYKKPLREKGIREPPYWHFIKLCWFRVHFDDVLHEISIRKFCKNFFELVVFKGIIEDLELEYNLEWDYFDDEGNILIPDYDKLMNPKSKPKKYKWYDHYPIFRTDRLNNIDNSELEKYIRMKPELNNHSIRVIRTCNKRDIHFNKIENETGKNMDYHRNKNSETRRNEETAWCQRVGVDETKLKIDVTDSTNEGSMVLTPEEIKTILEVSSNPDEETQKFLEEIGHEN